MEKKTENEILYEKTLESIDELYSDTSVSQRECLDNLNGLIDQISIKIEIIQNEMEKE